MIQQKRKIETQHKKAFSMVTAIFTIVIMATLTSLIMGITGKTIHETTAQYQKEQASLLARSYTELAILYALHRDRTVSCVKTIGAKFGEDRVSNYDPSYRVRVNIQYAGNVNNVPVANCDIIGLASGGNWADNGNVGFNASISLLIDVYVSYKDMSHPLNTNADTTDDIEKTFHRRTLQRI